MATLLNIGSVEFRRLGWHPEGSRCKCSGHYLPLLGYPRAALLRLFKAGQALPGKLVACTSNPMRDIKPEEVEWGT